MWKLTLDRHVGVEVMFAPEAMEQILPLYLGSGVGTLDHGEDLAI